MKRVVVVLVFLMVGCGSSVDDDGSGPTATKIAGTVGEWFVRMEVNTVDVGEVTFAVTNFGAILHEFVVVRSNYDAGAIPMAAGGVFDERDPGIDVIGEIPDWPGGQARSLTVDLAAGVYELVCNLPGHYAAGMHSMLAVG